MEYFLCDLFDVPNVSKIDKIDSLFDTNNKTLNYHSIFSHFQFQFSITVRYIWKQMFGIEPSKITVYVMFKHYGKDIIDVSLITLDIVNHSFYKFICKSIEEINNIIKSACSFRKNLNDYVMKQLIIHKLQRIVDKPYNQNFEKGFFKYYSDSINPSCFYNEQKYSIMRNNLCNVNIFTKFSLYPNHDFDEWISLTVEDCISYQISNDFYFLRLIYNRNVLISLELKYLKLSKEILNKYSQYDMFFITLTDTHLNSRKIINDCIPNLFNLQVYLGDEVSISGKGKKNLAICDYNSKDNNDLGSTYNTQMFMSDFKSISNQNHKLFCFVPCFDDNIPYSYDLLLYFFDLHLKLENCNDTHSKYFLKSTLISYLYIVKYFFHVGLSLLPFPKTKLNDIPRNNCILYIDNRCNILGIISMLITHKNISDDWDIVILGSYKSITYYKNFFGDYAKYIHKEDLEENSFKMDNYNKLLKDANTWKSLSNYELCLLIQDDSMIMRNGIEQFYSYDYVGPPWLDCTGNEQLKDYMGEKLVGNGGLSLRRVKCMHSICINFDAEKYYLFNSQLQPIQEDVYFAMCLNKIKSNIPSEREAELFGTEEVFNVKSLGFHKFWVYNSINQVIEYFESIF